MPIESLLGDFSAAAAGGDTARLAALFTPDGCYDDYFFGPHRGREAIVRMLERFYVGGEQFRWQFLEPLANERLAYARYCFSYRAREGARAGELVVFEGMARLRLRDGLIEDYAEVFDRGVAFVQLGYEPVHVHKLLVRYADGFRAGPTAQDHLRWREPRPAG